jgi:hypothetical protein
MPTSPYELLPSETLSPATTAALSYDLVFQHSEPSLLTTAGGQQRRLRVLPQLALTALALTASSISLPQTPVSEPTRFHASDLVYRASKSAVQTISLSQARQLALAVHREVESRLEEDRASEARWANLSDKVEPAEV